MTTTQKFRTDNTQGYTASQLTEMNAEWARQGGASLDDQDDADASARLAERIQTAHDRG